jgi:hypothetical protein
MLMHADRYGIVTRDDDLISTASRASRSTRTLWFARAYSDAPGSAACSGSNPGAVRSLRFP